jgi:uncharacterized protein
MEKLPPMFWLLLLLSLLLLYTAVLVAIAWFSLHPPRIPIFLSPGSIGGPQEEVEFVSHDGLTLRGWWLSHPEARGVAVLPHGYLMNRAELTPQAVKLWQEGFSCLLFDFRAHGRSQGRKCTMGVVERKDIIAAVRFAKGREPGRKVVLIGSSMGAAASVLAQEEEPGLADALVLDSAYAQLPVAILGWWRFLGGKPLAFLLGPTPLIAGPFAGFNPFSIDISESLQRISDVPVLIMHGDKDDLALPDEARRNIAACGGRAEVLWLQGCSHSEGRWIHPELYQRTLMAFLVRSGF